MISQHVTLYNSYIDINIYIYRISIEYLPGTYLAMQLYRFWHHHYQNPTSSPQIQRVFQGADFEVSRNRRTPAGPRPRPWAKRRALTFLGWFCGPVVRAWNERKTFSKRWQKKRTHKSHIYIFTYMYRHIYHILDVHNCIYIIYVCWMSQNYQPKPKPLQNFERKIG